MMNMESVKIVIGGDIFPKNAHGFFKEGKIDRLFSKEIIELFRTADFSICNLEGALTHAETKIPKCGPNLKAPPETAEGIKRLGLDYVSLANNHVTDFGVQGYLDTCKALANHNIGFFGAGSNIDTIKTHISVKVKEKRIVFYAVSETVFNIPQKDFPGVNLYDEYRVCKELEELKNNCDILIVLYHGGVEYFRYPTPWIRKRFHRMVDSGADIVIAQHTHCIGTMEYYKDSYLLYGQGNFYFEQDNELDFTQTGLLLEIDFFKNTFKVNHHLVYRDKDMVKYDVDQDLTGFYERNQKLADGDTFKKEFSAYSEKWLVRWLMEFRGLRFMDRVARKVLSHDKFVLFLRRRYKDITVLRMLEHVRGEEDVEVMQRGLTDFFEKR